MSVQKAVKSSHYEAESSMEHDVISQFFIKFFFFFLNKLFIKLCYVFWLFYHKNLNFIDRSLEKHGFLSQVVLTSYGEVTLGIGSFLKKTGTFFILL